MAKSSIQITPDNVTLLPVVLNVPIVFAQMATSEWSITRNTLILGAISSPMSVYHAQIDLGASIDFATHGVTLAMTLEPSPGALYEVGLIDDDTNVMTLLHRSPGDDIEAINGTFTAGSNNSFQLKLTKGNVSGPVKLTIKLSGPGGHLRLSKLGISLDAPAPKYDAIFESHLKLRSMRPGSVAHYNTGLGSDNRFVQWQDPSMMGKDIKKDNGTVTLDKGRYVVVSLLDGYANPKEYFVKSVSIQLAATVDGIPWEIGEINIIKDLKVAGSADDAPKPEAARYQLGTWRTALKTPEAHVGVIEVAHDKTDVQFSIIDIPKEVDFTDDPSLVSSVNVFNGPVDFKTLHSRETSSHALASALNGSYTIELFEGLLVIIKDDNNTFGRAKGLEPVLADIMPFEDSVYDDKEIFKANSFKLQRFGPIADIDDFVMLCLFGYNPGQSGYNSSAISTPEAITYKPGPANTGDVFNHEVYIPAYNDTHGSGAPFVVVFNNTNKFYGVSNDPMHRLDDLAKPWSDQHLGGANPNPNFFFIKGKGNDFDAITYEEIKAEAKVGRRVQYSVRFACLLRSTVSGLTTFQSEWAARKAISQVKATAYLIGYEELLNIKTTYPDSLIIASQTFALADDLENLTVPLTGFKDLGFEEYLDMPRVFAIAIRYEAVTDGLLTPDDSEMINSFLSPVFEAAYGGFELYENDFSLYTHPLQIWQSVQPSEETEWSPVVSNKMLPVVLTSGTLMYENLPYYGENESIKFFPMSGGLFQSVGDETRYQLSDGALSFKETGNYMIRLHGEVRVNLLNLTEWPDDSVATIVFVLVRDNTAAGEHNAVMVTDATITIKKATYEAAIQSDFGVQQHWDQSLVKYFPLDIYYEVPKDEQNPESKYYLTVGYRDFDNNIPFINNKYTAHNSDANIKAGGYDEAADPGFGFTLGIDGALDLELFEYVDPGQPFSGFIPHKQPGLAYAATQQDIYATDLDPVYTYSRIGGNIEDNGPLLDDLGHSTQLHLDVTESNALEGAQNETGELVLAAGKYKIVGDGNPHGIIDWTKGKEGHIGAIPETENVAYTPYLLLVYEYGGQSIIIDREYIPVMYLPDGPAKYKLKLFERELTVDEGAVIRVYVGVYFNSTLVDTAHYSISTLSSDAPWEIHNLGIKIYRLDDNTLIPKHKPYKYTTPGIIPLEVDPHPGYLPTYVIGAHTTGYGKYNFSSEIANQGSSDSTVSSFDFTDDLPESFVRGSSGHSTISLSAGDWAVGFRDRVPGGGYDSPQASNTIPKIFTDIVRGGDDLLALFFQVVVYQQVWDPGENKWTEKTRIAASPDNDGDFYQVANDQSPEALEKALEPYCLAYKAWGDMFSHTYYNSQLEPEFTVAPPEPTTERKSICSITFKVVGLLAKKPALPFDDLEIDQHNFSVLFYKKGGK